MNPLDLPGPQFLALYAGLLAAALAVAAVLRWRLREPGGEPSPKELVLSPYEVAYLAGAEKLAIHAAIARLVQANVLHLDSGTLTLTHGSAALHADASAAERAVFAAVKSPKGSTLGEVRSAAAQKLGSLRQALEDLGLLVAAGQRRWAYFLPWLVVLSVPLFGAVKVCVGLSRDKPVSLLIFGCNASVFVAFVFFGDAILRSRRGDRALARLQQENAALEYSGRHDSNSLLGNDLVLAMGLFGLGVLSTGPLVALHSAFAPPAGSSSSCGTSCGSSSGGGCGGGCGGCGG